MSALGPWQIYRFDRPTLAAPSRAEAMRLAGRLYRDAQPLTIEHETTGERWSRVAGRWHCRATARPLHRQETV